MGVQEVAVVIFFAGIYCLAQITFTLMERDLGAIIEAVRESWPSVIAIAFIGLMVQQSC